jgi:hypothetical protein
MAKDPKLPDAIAKILESIGLTASSASPTFLKTSFPQIIGAKPEANDHEFVEWITKMG